MQSSHLGTRIDACACLGYNYQPEFLLLDVSTAIVRWGFGQNNGEEVSMKKKYGFLLILVPLALLVIVLFAFKEPNVPAADENIAKLEQFLRFQGSSGHPAISNYSVSEDHVGAHINCGGGITYGVEFRPHGSISLNIAIGPLDLRSSRVADFKRFESKQPVKYLRDVHLDGIPDYICDNYPDYLLGFEGESEYAVALRKIWVRHERQWLEDISRTLDLANYGKV